MTVAALRHLIVYPSFLHRMVIARAKTLDGRNISAVDIVYAQLTTSYGFTIYMHRAGATVSAAATEFLFQSTPALPEAPKAKEYQAQHSPNNFYYLQSALAWHLTRLVEKALDRIGTFFVNLKVTPYAAAFN